MQTELEEEVMLVEEVVGQKDLIVYNDDFNTFDHVIESLIKVCAHDIIQAEQCTLIIHYNGKCQVKRGEQSKLISMCTALQNRGLTAEVE